MPDDALLLEIRPAPGGGQLITIHSCDNRTPALPPVHARGPIGIATAVDVLRRRARAAGLLTAHHRPADLDPPPTLALPAAEHHRLEQALRWRMNTYGHCIGPSGRRYGPTSRQGIAIAAVLARLRETPRARFPAASGLDVRPRPGIG